MKRARKSQEEVEKLIAEVDKLRKQGMGTGAACAQMGLSTTSYHGRKFRARRSSPVARPIKRKYKNRIRPVLLDIPAAPAPVPGKLFAIYGAPHEILGLFRELAV